MTDFTGGCMCGALRYSITGAPLVMADCQCRHCQQISGTGHASHLVFAREAVTLTGTATLFDMMGDSGTIKTRAFCPTCGTPVSASFAANPGIVVVSAGSLDDPSRYAPGILTYHSRALAWDHIDAGLQAFDLMPPG